MIKAEDRHSAGTESTVAGPISTDETTPAPSVASSTAALPGGAFRPVLPGEYILRGEIARGGMGRIVRAEDARLGREVAIKELLSTGAEADRRFEREAQITARLQHPAIVPLHEAGRWPDGRLFYEMKLVSGKPLDRVLAETPTLADRLALLPSVLTIFDALAYAHGQRIIHRDLKPGNVLVGDFGETVVIDWGLAKDLADGTADEAGSPSLPSSVRSVETVAGAVLGTPAYMPPEQAEGRAVDERADVYALGAMLYHVLAGAPPYAAASASEVIAAVVSGPPLALGRRVPAAPPELVAIVARAMSREPIGRYPTAKEMAEDLRRYQTGQLVGSHRYTTWQLTRRFLRRHRLGLAALTAALTAATIVAAVTVTRIASESHRARDAEHGAEASAAELAREKEGVQQRYIQSLEGLAFQALLVGEPMRAAAYAVPVYEALPDDPAVRFLVARAMASIDPLERILTPRKPGAVWSAAFSPDGGRILTTTEFGGVELFDAATGAHLATPAYGGAGGGIATYSPDGERLAMACPDKAVRIWDAREGRALVTLTGPALGAVRLAWSPDGSLLATGGDDGTTRLWRTRTGALVVTLAGSNAAVNDVAFSPDGTRVATAGPGDLVQIWSTSGAPLVRLLARDSDALSAEWSPAGDRLVITYGSSAQIVDAGSGSPIARLLGHQGTVYSASFCPNGKWIVTAAEDRTARLWDAASGRPLATLEGHGDTLTSARCSPDSSRIVTASTDGTARLWAVPRAALLPTLGEGSSGQAALDGDGGELATGGWNHPQVWNLRNGMLLAALGKARDGTSAIALSRDGSLAASANADQTIALWNARTGAPLRILSDHTSYVWQVAFSPDGLHLASTSSDGTSRIWELATGRCLAILHGSGQVWTIAYSPDGSRLATGDDAGLALWDTASATPVWRADKIGEPKSVAFSPDGDRIVVGSSDTMAHLHDAHTGKLLMTLEGHAGPIEDARFSPDGALLLTASDDGTARVWDARAGEPLDSLSSSEGQGGVLAAAFSPDGRTAITTYERGPGRLWDVDEESRSPAAIAALVRARVPLRLDGGRLVPIAPNRLVPSPP